MIKIDFAYETKYGWYRDALYLPDDHTYTQDEITAMELERVNNWIYEVENPPEPDPPEPEIVVIDGVEYEKVEIDGVIVLKPVGV
jgi:hypothetical protein